ncbi:unnamed protein product [Lupinus luteus]|uniref:Copia protein n=1 Tax=Lupinus luteus TaxID=3873 RepID=A0AAV1W620_LUPLU
MASCQARWLTFLMKDLGIHHPCPINIYCNNKSALHIAVNPVFHERTKHIEIDCHVVRERVINNTIYLLPISTSQQISDIFTKSLNPLPFRKLISKLNMIDMHMQACGGC